VRRIALASALTALALAAPAVAAAPPGKVFYEETVKPGSSVAVAVTVRRPAAFRVLLRTRTVGRTKLFLLGQNAPGGGPLIDTKTYACDGAAGSFYCKASYESLPPGTYTFRIAYTGPQKVHVELTLRW
jgi:hypothetical protein